jgi:hypothetical protein
MKHRIFTPEDEISFAELSGDYNPLHLDPLVARRTVFGTPVVHGIHIVFWCLETWLKENPSPMNIRSIKAVFPRPIRVGEEAILTYVNEHDGHLRIEVSTGGAMASMLNIQWDRSKQRGNCCTEDRFPEKREPRVLSGEEIAGQTGTIALCLNIDAVTKMFPNLVQFISHMQIATILCTTRLVGVECPGMYSMYSEMNLVSGEYDPREVQYKVTKFDRRFGLAFLNITAPGMSGTIKAFIHPRQHNQADYNIIRKFVKTGEFAGQRALIVGGSRGLGEVVAKLLTAGSAEIKVTYHQGEREARRVVDEININGGTASSLQFNVLYPDKDTVNKLLSGWDPTHLYYFATPSIFVGTKGIFSSDLFTKFCDYYIKGFLNTINYVKNTSLKSVYCPSTVAIDELPLDMGEYAAAKTAAETLCSFLEKSNKNMTFHSPRLPRMSTDQTVSMLRVKNNDPIPVLITHLRNLRDASAST